ncbi:MAG: hypothetical protein Q8T13_02735 [Acidobacteriota bacterium]|nr:hypothetical protein [Acidobacteriota bacterium]
MKKTSRSPKSASPAPPLEEKKKKKPSPAADKTPVRAATRRKRPAAETPVAPDAVSPVVEVSDEDIRIRAYFLSIEYRGSDRQDVDFWLLAERELRPPKPPGKR